jgi:hypothetical protein
MGGPLWLVHHHLPISNFPGPLLFLMKELGLRFAQIRGNTNPYISNGGAAFIFFSLFHFFCLCDLVLCSLLLALLLSCSFALKVLSGDAGERVIRRASQIAPSIINYILVVPLKKRKKLPLADQAQTSIRQGQNSQNSPPISRFRGLRTAR